MNYKRIVSGVLMVVTVTLCLLFLPLDFLTFLVAAIVCLSTWEFYRLRFSSGIALLLSLALFLSLIYLSFGVGFQLSLIFVGFLSWLIFGVLILGFPHNKNILQNGIFWFFSGFLIHVSFWTSLFFILDNSAPLLDSIGIGLSSRNTLIFLICLTSLMDSLAYFGGKRFGKRKFLSNISPSKTLEGFLIALAGTPLIIMPLLAFFYDYNFVALFIIIVIVSLFSVLGDTTASLFKRITGAKDSSNLIPGHGGVLDRIDSHLAAAPCFVCLSYLIKTF